jgi:hypothetical protein
MLFKVFGIVVCLILGAIIGLNLSKNINNSILYSIFWLLYVITFLTISNLIAVSLFYGTLQSKRGPPGPRGAIGEAGEVGDQGVCQEGCQQLECSQRIETAFVEELNKLAKNPTPPIVLNNFMLKQKIKEICTSKQFNSIISVKGAESTINYIIDIWREWAKLLYTASGRKFVESVGGEENYKWDNNKNPFDIMEKYDIYHWKLNKLFKPIGIDICDDPKINPHLPKQEKPRLSLIMTNIYNWIYNDKGTGAKHDFSSWRAAPALNKETNQWHYPMGDIGVLYRKNENSGPKTIDGVVNDTLNNKSGPKKITALVAGDVKPPVRFELKWNDKGSGGKYDGSFWQPIAPHGYTCIGDVTHNSYQPPNTNIVRCIPDDCVEIVKDNTNFNGQYVWADRGSGAKKDGSVWQIKDSQTDGIGNKRGEENYNLIRTVNAFSGWHAPFYKIKDKCLVSSIPPKKNVEESDWIANTWHGEPERQEKYSIFKFLNLVPEGIIQNYNTNHKYYFVSTNKEANSYIIKYQNQFTKAIENLETLGKDKVWQNPDTNVDKIEQQWELIYTDDTNVNIRSKATKQYLGTYYQDSWKLIFKQYNKLDGNITKWKINKTTTGGRKIPQNQSPKKNTTNTNNTNTNNTITNKTTNTSNNKN